MLDTVMRRQWLNATSQFVVCSGGAIFLAALALGHCLGAEGPGADLGAEKKTVENQAASAPDIVRVQVNAKYENADAQEATTYAYQVCAILLDEAGLKKVGPGAKVYDAALDIKIAGKALSYEMGNERIYSGADIRVEISLQGKSPCSHEFQAVLAPDSRESRLSGLIFNRSPKDAPFGDVLQRSDLVGTLARIIARTWRKDEIALLTKVMEHENAFIQFGAAAGLARLGAPGMRALVSAAHQKSTAGRAAWGLSLKGEAGLQELLKLSKSEDAQLRRTGIGGLGWASDCRGLEAALQAVKDSDPQSRISAIWALGRIGGKEAAAALSAALQDENAEVRKSSVIGLIDMGRPAISELIRALTSKDASVRALAAAALAKYKDPASVPTLIAGLKDADRDVKWWCLCAIKEMGDVRTIDALIDLLGEDDDILLTSVEDALVRIGSPAVPALIDAMKKDKQEARLSAIKALGSIGDERALPVLRRTAAAHEFEREGSRARMAIEDILARKTPK